MMQINTLPEVKTPKQKKLYTESLGVEYDARVNGFSKILVNGTKSKLHKNGHHHTEHIDVIIKPHKEGEENTTRVRSAVNIGTYFSGFSQSNMFIAVKDYDAFIKEYSPSDYSTFTRDHNAAQELAKINSSNARFKFEVFVTSNLQASYRAHSKYIIQPLMFVRSNPCGDRASMVMHYELEDWFSKGVLGVLLEKNMQIVRYLQQGNNEPLVDRITGERIECIELPIKTKVVANVYELHHIKVVAGKSADKDGADPAALLRRNEIIGSKDQAKTIIELMKTIAISKNSHGLIHKMWHSGLSDLYKSQWPHVLQSEKNFNAACKKYNLGKLDYKQFIADLK